MLLSFSRLVQQGDAQKVPQGASRQTSLLRLAERRCNGRSPFGNPALATCKRWVSKSLLLSKVPPRPTWYSPWASLRIRATAAREARPPSRCFLRWYQALANGKAFARLACSYEVGTLRVCVKQLRFEWDDRKAAVNRRKHG